MACEAAGAIRTVAALTRENDCLELYSHVRPAYRVVSSSCVLPLTLLLV